MTTVPTLDRRRLGQGALALAGLQALPRGGLPGAPQPRGRGAPAGGAAGALPGPLERARGRIAACVDVAPGGAHASLAAAAQLEDGRIRVEVVAAWEGPTALQDLARDLPDWVRKIRPKMLGWFPKGPAAAVDALLRDRTKATRQRLAWPPRGVKVDEIEGLTAAVVMGFAEQVSAGRIVHSRQALLDAHVEASEKLWTGDRWVLTRRGSGNVDAAYAAAGATHLARTMPRPRGGTRRFVSGD